MTLNPKLLVRSSPNWGLILSPKCPLTIPINLLGKRYPDQISAQKPKIYASPPKDTRPGIFQHSNGSIFETNGPIVTKVGSN